MLDQPVPGGGDAVGTGHPNRRQASHTHTQGKETLP